MKRSLLAAAALASANAWVLPGTAPQQFLEGQQIELKVNKLTSPKTHLGYENYQLKFCRVSPDFCSLWRIDL